MKTPEVTIIVPVYNAEKTLKRLVASVLDQSFRNFELLLVDDGSTDSTPKILSKFSTDNRVVVLKKENGGPSSARNLAIKKSRGKYIAFCDSDDTLAPGSLLRLVSVAESSSSDLVVSGWNTTILKNNKEFKRKSTIPQERIVDNDIIQQTLRSLGDNGEMYSLWNKLFKSRIIKNNHLRFDEKLRFGEDMIFILKYVEHVSRISFIPIITYNYYLGIEGSVYGSSSLSPDYRKINSKALVNFSKLDKSDVTYNLSKWVQARWLLSYSMLMSKSKLSYTEKLERINLYDTSYLKKFINKNVVGTKKFVLYRLIYMLRNRTMIMLTVGYIAKTLKDLSK